MQRITAVVLFLFLAVAARAEVPPPLGAAAVKSLFAGNTVDAVTALERFWGKSFHIYMKSDRTLVITLFDGSTDTGVWEVTDDGHYCNQYANTRKRMRKCFTVHDISNGKYELRTSEGTLSSRFTIRQGNPDGL